MYDKGLDARLRNLARHTLCDTLSTRKEELPQDLCQDAVNALADLPNSTVWTSKDKMLCAMKVESMLLRWMPPSESVGSDHSDYEYEYG